MSTFVNVLYLIGHKGGSPMSSVGRTRLDSRDELSKLLRGSSPASKNRVPACRVPGNHAQEYEPWPWFILLGVVAGYSAGRNSIFRCRTRPSEQFAEFVPGIQPGSAYRRHGRSSLVSDQI